MPHKASNLIKNTHEKSGSLARDSQSAPIMCKKWHTEIPARNPAGKRAGIFPEGKIEKLTCRNSCRNIP